MSLECLQVPHLEKKKKKKKKKNLLHPQFTPVSQEMKKITPAFTTSESGRRTIKTCSRCGKHRMQQYSHNLLPRFLAEQGIAAFAHSDGIAITLVKQRVALAAATATVDAPTLTTMMLCNYRQ